MDFSVAEGDLIELYTSSGISYEVVGNGENADTWIYANSYKVALLADTNFENLPSDNLTIL